ncbi:receptor-like protein kinase At5g59670 [Raphanus sativus]|uniref:Receptor-like protein kinase At5g59670 n=1 Tax=Raphanus sativus TaxID=3726 RepID=A0A9W3DB95_RAPSA|nr:receptor-like protein kinase At5g59670 [Raphanus sativus]
MVLLSFLLSKESMESCCIRVLLVLIATWATIHIVHAQDQEGFISLDRGLPTYELSPYKEITNGLWFSSDEKFIQSGNTGRSREIPERYTKQYETLRYFPNGTRNCYNLSVDKGRKYLIKAKFLYGNYDGLHIEPVFDLYLGPNLWATVDLVTMVNGTREEILHVSTSSSLQICLVKTGTTTPVISTLELRPVVSGSYITESGSLKLYDRYYLNKTGSRIR